MGQGGEILMGQSITLEDFSCGTLKSRGLVGSPLCFLWEFLKSVVVFSKSKRCSSSNKQTNKTLPGWLGFRNKIKPHPLRWPSLTDGWAYRCTQCHFLHWF